MAPGFFQLQPPGAASAIARGICVAFNNLVRQHTDLLPSSGRAVTFVYCNSSVSVRPLVHEREGSDGEFAWSNKSVVETRQTT